MLMAGRGVDVEGVDDAVSYMKEIGCKTIVALDDSTGKRTKQRFQARFTRESQRRLEVLPFGGAKGV